MKTAKRTKRLSMTSTLKRSKSKTQKQCHLSKPNKRAIASHLRCCIDFDKELELSKIDLAVKADFNLAVAFKLFDQESRGWFHHFDMKDGLTRLGINSTSSDCQLFVRKFDSDSDGRITFEEFKTAFTPLRSEYAKLVKSTPPPAIASLPRGKFAEINVREFFEKETIVQLKKTLRTHLSIERELEKKRFELS